LFGCLVFWLFRLLVARSRSAGRQGWEAPEPARKPETGNLNPETRTLNHPAESGLDDSLKASPRVELKRIMETRFGLEAPTPKIPIFPRPKIYLLLAQTSRYLIMGTASNAPAFRPGQFRERFRIPVGPRGREAVYLCGHSLGLQPRAAADAVEAELERWGRLGVAGRFDGPLAWVSYHELMTDSLAELAGAHPSEVVAMGSLTGNLHQMMISFFHPHGDRRRILIEKGAYSTIRHAAESQLTLHGLDPARNLVELAPRRDGLHHEEDIEDYLERYGETVALVLWPGVHYATGQVFDIDRIVRSAARAGARTGFDLSGAIGNIELAVHDSGADFAVWSSEKYLNGGPGTIAGCFVHDRHADFHGPRLAGWWGHEPRTRFAMGPEFHPVRGAAGWQQCNPPILAAAALRASLEVIQEAGGMRALRKSSLDLTGQLAREITERLGEHLRIITPREPHRHGAQLSLKLRSGERAGRELFERLEAHGVVCDWRQPGIMRAAPAPLYNNEHDIAQFVDLMEKLIDA
jgi:kynureninase